MPETIIVPQATLPVGQSAEAVIIGRDGRTEVRTRANVTRISDDFIRVGDDDARSIFGAVVQDGHMSFYVTAGMKPVAARRRKAQLQKATDLLRELTTCLQAIAADDDEPGFSEAVQQLFDWLREKAAQRAIK